MSITLNQLRTAMQSVLNKLKSKAEAPDLQENDPNSLSYIKGRVGGYTKNGKPVKFPREYMPVDYVRVHRFESNVAINANLVESAVSEFENGTAIILVDNWLAYGFKDEVSSGSIVSYRYTDSAEPFVTNTIKKSNNAYTFKRKYGIEARVDGSLTFGNSHQLVLRNVSMSCGIEGTSVADGLRIGNTFIPGRYNTDDTLNWIGVGRGALAFDADGTIFLKTETYNDDTIVVKNPQIADIDSDGFVYAVINGDPQWIDYETYNYYLENKTLLQLIARTITEIDIPEGTTSVKSCAFGYCKSLRRVRIPNSVTYLGYAAFRECGFEQITIPANVLNVNERSFLDCLSLLSVTFLGTPNAIHSSAFVYCSNLTTIKVPWAEGAVANAPWGATNATITYNYTEAM